MVEQLLRSNDGWTAGTFATGYTRRTNQGRDAWHTVVRRYFGTSNDCLSPPAWSAADVAMLLDEYHAFAAAPLAEVLTPDELDALPAAFVDHRLNTYELAKDYAGSFHSGI